MGQSHTESIEWDLSSDQTEPENGSKCEKIVSKNELSEETKYHAGDLKQFCRILHDRKCCKLYINHKQPLLQLISR